MLIIRFSRVGKKNYAQYKLVLAEKTYPIQGKFIEHLGSYDPHQKKAKLNKGRINYWIEKGAQCSDSVHNLLVREEVIKGEKRFLKLGKKKKEIEGEESKTDKKEDEGKDEKKEGEEEKVEEKKEKSSSAEEKKETPKEEVKEEKKTEDNKGKEDSKVPEIKEEKK
jgi:small subunit ribosomal protein S16